jgi:hypothetical protein
MTVVEAASVIRLGSIARASAVYEAIPAFQSIESAASPLLALRPGSIELCALFPFFRKRKKKISEQEVSA